MEVGTHIILKQLSKLLSNTFDVNQTSKLYLNLNLRFCLLNLVTWEFVFTSYGSWHAQSFETALRTAFKCFHVSFHVN